MAIDTDDEILQDFLIEAGEILEQLGEQLVDLERQPQDKDLLNAVFRGFHTVKGGAGFLNLTNLVEICHRAEDVFNVLRQGERHIDAQLMDAVLRSLDVINEMVDGIRSGVEPQPADPALLRQLESFAGSEEHSGATSEPAASKEETETEAAPPAQAAQASTPAETAPDQHGSAEGEEDEITEEEFERLLDQLHGGSAPKKSSPVATRATDGDISSAKKAGDDGQISEEEFDALLDQRTAARASQEKDSASAAAVSPPAAPSGPSAVEPRSVGQPSASPKTAAMVPPAELVAAVQSDPGQPVVGPGKPGVPKAGAQKEQPMAETTVRVDTKRLDDIMNLVGELVLVRNRLATLRTAMSDEVAKAVANLDLVTADLQNSVMKTRMQPIKKVFGRFPRVVRDLARSLNKQVSLELHGEETDLDKNLVEALADPLVHLVRNAVDHGIEPPEKRVAAGKPACGTVILSAEQEGDHILLSIKDDGAGMNADVLRRKAIEKGIIDGEAAARLDDRACYGLIFAPGFSTKDEISDISGRGVGMDVVKTRITQLNGTIEIDSEPGKGSRIVIKVPLTLAIMPTLMVQLQDQIFALPLANVIEIVDHESAKTSTVDGKRVVIVRDKALPMVFLREWLIHGNRNGRPVTDDGYVVVVSYGSQHIGCVVDQLIGQEEVVIKPLGSMLQGTKGLAGATITGNGRIALILDMPGLMERYARRA